MKIIDQNNLVSYDQFVFTVFLVDHFNDEFGVYAKENASDLKRYFLGRYDSLEKAQTEFIHLHDAIAKDVPLYQMPQCVPSKTVKGEQADANNQSTVS